MTRVLAVLSTLALAAGAARADLADRLDTPYGRPIAQALALAVGRALPIPAASSGITFTFDPKTSAFERETDVLGQIFLERARPIGRGKWSLSMTYQRVHLDTFDGMDLDSLSDTGDPIVDGQTGDLFTIPQFDLDLTTQLITMAAAYGVTDDLEVDLTLPLAYTSFSVDAVARDLTDGHVQRTHVRDSAFGVADIFLRGKYRFLHGALGDVAAGLVFRLPSGNEDDFQGAGRFALSPMLYVSTRSFEAAPGMRFQGYLNAGVDLVPQAVSESEVRGGVGVDCALAERVTLSVAFLVREPFNPLVPPDFFDVERADGSRAPVLGLSPGHPTYYDLAVGGRVNLWRDSVFGLFNVIVPLNRDGVRADVIPLVGIEVTF